VLFTRDVFPTSFPSGPSRIMYIEIVGFFDFGCSHSFHSFRNFCLYCVGEDGL